MADLKISELTNLTAADPANDMIPIVDVSATPPASGSTKRISINNILACSPTATLASATISGDLTVDTSTLKVDSANNRVGIGTATPGTACDVASGTVRVKNAVGDTSGLLIYQDTGDASKIFNYYNGSMQFGINNTTAMTLNATGLGIGASPSQKLHVKGIVNFEQISGGTNGWQLYTYTDGTYRMNYNGAGSDELIIDTTGNVGIGVAPSAWSGTFKMIETLGGSFGTNSNGALYIPQNATFNSGWLYKNTLPASYYTQAGGAHQFFTAPSGTAGTAINDFATPKMTLDASGNLLVGTTTNTNVSRIFSRGTATSSALALQGASGDVALAQLTVGKFDNNTTTSQIFVRFTINDNSGGSGQINANGASQAAFGTFSDSRLKENIVSLPSQLANIMSLRPVEFDYKDGSGHQIGFVAQEMQEVYSDAVGEQNGFLTVTGWSKTEARLVSAIKELAAKVQALEAKLA